jgi:hypothetical protein
LLIAHAHPHSSFFEEGRGKGISIQNQPYAKNPVFVFVNFILRGFPLWGEKVLPTPFKN